jgi:hypothetical protein
MTPFFLSRSPFPVVGGLSQPPTPPSVLFSPCAPPETLLSRSKSQISKKSAQKSSTFWAFLVPDLALKIQIL